MNAVTALVGSWFSVRRVITVVVLTLAWCALWGSVSVANLLSGVVVSLVGLAFGVRRRERGGIRVGPLLHFAGSVALDMVRSTFSVIREVLTPTDYTEEGIIAVPLPVEGRRHLLLVFVAITVTPGTAVVASEADGSVLYLHVLHRADSDAVRAHTVRLAELADRALPMAPADDGPTERQESR